MFDQFISYSAVVAVIIVAILFWWMVIQLVIHPPSKEETGETMMSKTNASLCDPDAQEPYDAGQTPTDGKIVVAQWYRMHGTPEQRVRATLELRKLGMSYR